MDTASAWCGRHMNGRVRGGRRLLVVVCLLSIGLTASASAAAGGGGRIVWTRNAAASPRAQIVSARPDGSHLQALTHPEKRRTDIDAQISPDGKRVAFERQLTDTSKIAIVRANGQNAHFLDLGCVDPCAGDSTPTWLPAGTRIAFTPVIGPFDQPNDSARSAVLHTALPNGSDVQRLSEPGIDGKFEDYRARYSHDGSYIVFLRISNADLHVAVFRMDADGSDVRRLTPWKLDADEADLSLATNGPTKNRIVFETYGMGAPPGKSQNIATVPSTCGTASECREKIRYVTHHKGGPVQNFNPSWSPNGRRIAYTRFKDRPCCVGDIWTARADGSHPKAVSKSPRFEYRPDWGPAPSG